MINRYWLRKRLGQTKGMRKVTLILCLGALCFLVGSALSFKVVILPMLEAVERLFTQSLSSVVSRDNLETARHIVGGVLLFLGFYLLYLGLRDMVIRFVETITGQKGGVVDVYRKRQELSQGPRIVAIGGGTGLSTMLRGLKQKSSNITAVVTVTDDGGSSGRLTREKGMIPPGDIRNCLVALADAEKSMTDLFQHRFKSDSGTLSGHSIGNLLIAALVDQSQGDFEKAVEKASDVLLIRGRVVPSTLSHVRLRALMEDGTEICGETQIAGAGKRIRRLYLDPEDVHAHPAVIDAIRDADLICIGPGSVYTSVIPNLLVKGIAEALMESTAPKVYICNVMTQPGESDSFTAAEHVTVIRANTDHKVFDYVMVNTAMPSPQLVEKYRESGQYVVESDVDRIRAMGYKVLGGNFMSETDFVRHDPMQVADRLMSLLSR